MSHISEPHYHQGRAIYDGGGTVRQLIETSGQLEAQCDAAHRAVEIAPVEPGINSDDVHRAISDTYRDAGPSIIAGFLDGFLVEIRRLTRSRGQTA